MKATTGIEKVIGGWTATFSIGVQTFRLDTYDDKEHAEWYKKQLDTAFTNLNNGDNDDLEEIFPFEQCGDLTHDVSNVEEECKVDFVEQFSDIPLRKRKEANVSNADKTLAIQFALYLVGHDKETIEKMFANWMKYK